MAKTRSWISNDKVLNDGMARIRQMADDAIVESLDKLAKLSIDNALLNKGYTNRTYNLHDSYGFAIYHNGAIVKKWMNSPEATKPDAKGGTGALRGSTFLDNFSSTGNWQLVVVAGEFYADQLQFGYGLDVLSGAYQYSEQNFLNDFKKIQ